MLTEPPLAKARIVGLTCRPMAKPRFAFDADPKTAVIVCKRVLAGKSVLEVATR